MAELTAAAVRLDERRFDAFELRAEGTELTVGMLGTHKLARGRLLHRRRDPSLPEPPDGRGLHDAGPAPDGGVCDVDEAARAA